MSLLARRSHEEAVHRERALVAMRDAVVAATTAYMPMAGSSATLEAVDKALAQLVSARAPLGEPAAVLGCGSPMRAVGLSMSTARRTSSIAT